MWSTVFQTKGNIRFKNFVSKKKKRTDNINHQDVMLIASDKETHELR